MLPPVERPTAKTFLLKGLQYLSKTQVITSRASVWLMALQIFGVRRPASASPLKLMTTDSYPWRVAQFTIFLVIPVCPVALNPGNMKSTGKVCSISGSSLWVSAVLQVSSAVLRMVSVACFYILSITWKLFPWQSRFIYPPSLRVKNSDLVYLNFPYQFLQNISLTSQSMVYPFPPVIHYIVIGVGLNTCFLRAATPRLTSALSSPYNIRGSFVCILAINNR